MARTVLGPISGQSPIIFTSTPARGGLLRLEGKQSKDEDRRRDPLWHYPWSSYPGYRAWKKRRPAWLITDRVLGEHGLSDNSWGRRSYSEYLEKRASEKNMKRSGEWDQLRRGWCLGGQSFRDRMLDKIEGVLAGKKEESYSGEMKKDHDRSRAEHMVCKALGVLGVEESKLVSMKKSAVEKEVIASLVHRKTNVRIAWIAKRLQMGHPSSVTVAVKKTMKNETKQHRKLSGKLNKFLDFKD